MSFAARPRVEWRLRERVLALGERTRVFGVVNCTPDSFSGDGLRGVEQAVQHGLRLLDEGADGLDVGGESTRPGSGAGGPGAIGAAEEQERVLPVIEGLLRERPGALISVDTYRAATARAAVSAGAEVVNDVSGLGWDAGMAETCARLGCGVIVMHTRGRPQEWASLPPVPAKEVVPMVREGLRERLAQALAAGVERGRIVVDAGFGFGKKGGENYALLHRQAELLSLGHALMAGVSRKSFLGQTLAALWGRAAVPPPERDQATAAASVAAVLGGASLLRVHAVRAAVESAAVADAVLRAGQA